TGGRFGFEDDGRKFQWIQRFWHPRSNSRLADYQPANPGRIGTVNLKYSAILLLLCLPLTVVGKSGSRDLASAERKIDHIEANGRSPHPNQTPTIFSEAEVNAYLASDNIQLPNGVQSVK